ncbi:polysaccharide deacetylase family protein [Lactococcus petauri]|uniref:polysaccharide deacetylase family protein n=1 Tax=Lactococcus petauri TaxID=1940789 RepID=UPI0013FD2908|nr:hypothetical protein [Lactococcus petauri]NHJ19078.1 hypothetical protein [Lactococcus garvieae]
MTKKNWNILIFGIIILCIIIMGILWIKNDKSTHEENYFERSKVLKGIDIVTKQENSKSYRVFADYPKVKNEDINQGLEAFTDGEIAAFKVNYPENQKVMSEFYQNFETHRLSANIVGFKFNSMIMNKSMANPINSVHTKSYNLKTGSPLYITDILSSTSSLSEISKIAYDKLSNEKIYKENKEEVSDLKEGLYPKEENFENFLLDNNDLILFFKPYQIGSRSNPVSSVKIPFNELDGIVKEEYLKSDSLNDSQSSSKALNSQNKKGEKSLGKKKLVALTFDDGPAPETTLRLLSILKKENVPATFFVLGNRVQFYPEIVRKAYQEGHQIGSHTYNHLNLPELPIEEAQKEVNMTRDIIKQTIGKDPEGTRPPYGATTPQITTIVNNPVIQWSVDSLDWQSKNADSIEQTVLSEVYDGSIILMHDIYDSSVDGAQKVIIDLKKQGYTFVTVNQLIESRGNLENGKQYFDAVK